MPHAESNISVVVLWAKTCFLFGGGGELEKENRMQKYLDMRKLSKGEIISTGIQYISSLNRLTCTEV